MRVLLVDDEVTWVESTAQKLEHQRQHFSVETATSKSGASALLTERTDCIVCDYDLGDGTGLELLSERRVADDDRPFILITGRGNESVASDAIGRRVTDYIPKRSLGGQSDLLARRIEAAVVAHRRQKALAKERRSKDAMLDILRSMSSQEGIIQRYCDHIHREHGYECVWIGTIDRSFGVLPQAVAGTEDYTHEVLTPDTDPANATEPGLVAAARTTTYTATNLDDIDASAHWQTAAKTYGFERAAATPITHDGTTFGVLAVYDSKPEFETDELSLLEEYGETIAYALRSANWKDALLATQPVTIELAFSDSDIPLLGLVKELPAESRLTVLTTVLYEESLLYVLRATEVTAATLRDSVSICDGILDYTTSDDSKPLRCEVVVAQPTPETILAEVGGRVVETTAARDTVWTTVVTEQSSGPHSLVDAIRTAYPDAEVQSIVGGDDVSPEISRDGILSSLTPKQRRALELAYFSGYFQRPRENDTTEVAEKLGVSRQTLTQHLRAGENKIFGELFEANSDRQE